MQHEMRSEPAGLILLLPFNNKEGGQKVVLETKEKKYLPVNNNHTTSQQMKTGSGNTFFLNPFAI